MLAISPSSYFPLFLTLNICLWNLQQIISTSADIFCAVCVFCFSDTLKWWQNQNLSLKQYYLNDFCSAMRYLARLPDLFVLVFSFVTTINSSFCTHSRTCLQPTLERNALLVLLWPLSTYHLLTCNLNSLV